MYTIEGEACRDRIGRGESRRMTEAVTGEEGSVKGYKKWS